jgi:hypothetical protein
MLSGEMLLPELHPAEIMHKSTPTTESSNACRFMPLPLMSTSSIVFGYLWTETPRAGNAWNKAP